MSLNDTFATERGSVGSNLEVIISMMKASAIPDTSRGVGFVPASPYEIRERDDYFWTME